MGQPKRLRESSARATSRPKARAFSASAFRRTARASQTNRPCMASSSWAMASSDKGAGGFVERTGSGCIEQFSSDWTRPKAVRHVWRTGCANQLRPDAMPVSGAQLPSRHCIHPLDEHTPLWGYRSTSGQPLVNGRRFDINGSRHGCHAASQLTSSPDPGHGSDAKALPTASQGIALALGCGRQ